MSKVSKARPHARWLKSSKVRRPQFERILKSSFKGSQVAIFLKTLGGSHPVAGFLRSPRGALYRTCVSRVDVTTCPMSSNTAVYYLYVAGARVHALWGQFYEGA